MLRKCLLALEDEAASRGRKDESVWKAPERRQPVYRDSYIFAYIPHHLSIPIHHLPTYLLTTHTSLAG
jgi:hypothetical protein